MIKDFDSFDSYRTANLSEKYTVVGSGTSIQLGVGRCNSNCLQIVGAPGLRGALKGVTITGPTFQFGAAHYFVPGGFAAHFNIWTLYYGETPIVLIQRNISGGITWITNPDAAFPTIAFVSNGGWLPYSEWNSLTIGGTLNNAGAATVTFKLNGITVQTASFQTVSGFDTALFTAIEMGQGTFTNTQRYDDFFVGDLTGAINNTQLGDVHVQKMTLLGDVAVQWTPDGGSAPNALLVEDGDNPDTTKGIKSTTAGVVDLYSVEHLADVAGTQVFGVKASYLAQKDYSGDRSLGFVDNDGANHDAGVNVPITQANYQYSEIVMEADPATAAQWTVGGFNSRADTGMGPKLET